jgi:hypothetical protein
MSWLAWTAVVADAVSVMGCHLDTYVVSRDTLTQARSAKGVAG